MKHVLGVVGGTGVYEIPGLEQLEELQVDTPYGSPSDLVRRGALGDTTLLFLPRHGRGHRVAPHEINYRANICALKKLGAQQLISVSAVGSMRKYIEPGDLVVPHQFIDLTRRRSSTFFEAGVVAHVAFADPVCPQLSAALAAASRRVGATIHEGGIYVCIDGPQFSTRAESHLYRDWGVSVIGMTAMPEAKLAREAELPYAILALATDYDCWHQGEEDVSVEGVLAVMRKNAELAKRTLADLSARLPDPSHSIASTALATAIMTAPEHRPSDANARLGWLLGSR